MYKNKYLKYKTKYIRQCGGTNPSATSRLNVPDGKYTIPASFTTLCPSSFNNFKDVKTVKFGVDSHMSVIEKLVFARHPSIINITLPPSITELGKQSFMSCPNLKTVTFEDESQLKIIGEQSFSECRVLETVDFGKNSCLTEIKKEAFQFCESLKTITIPKSVEKINDDCFYSCYNLTKIIFEDESQLKTIGKQSFFACRSLETVDFGQNSCLTEIKKEAFMFCGKLETITIPKSVKKINEFCFIYCKNLTKIIFEDKSNIQEICYRSFPIHLGMTSSPH